MIKCKKIIILFVIIILTHISFPYMVFSETEKSSDKESAETSINEEEHVIEISFGASMLDIDDAFKVERSNSDEVRRYPVTSAMFLFELLAFSKVSFIGMLNVPLESRKVVRNGIVEEENVATSTGLGGTYTPVRFKTFKKAILEFQTALLGCTTVNSTSSRGNYLFPLIALRARIVSKHGFSLYIGSGYAFKKDTISLLYGIGHRF